MAKSKCVALLILNWKYSPVMKDLVKPQEDGQLMKKLMEDNKYHEVRVRENVDDIKTEVEEFIKHFKKNYTNIDVMHFHFSGHGGDINSVSFDPNKTSPYGSFESEDPNGECLAGCKGKFYSVKELKSDLVKAESQRYTIALDMCRSQPTRAAPSINKKYLNLSEEKPLETKYLERVFVFWATYELHPANDNPSFTKELYDLLDQNTSKALPIKEITKKINESWEKKGESQRCSDSKIERGDNWENFLWPSNNNEQLADSTEVDGGGNIAKTGPVKTQDKKATRDERGKRALEEKDGPKWNFYGAIMVACLVVFSIALARIALYPTVDSGARELQTKKHQDGQDIMKAVQPLIDKFESGSIGMATLKLLAEKFGNLDKYEHQLVSIDKPTNQAKAKALLEDWKEKGRKNNIGALIKILREIKLVSVAEDIEDLIGNIDST